MTFLDLAKDRFSVRSFKNEQIKDEELKKILEAGKVAPTACNFQPQKIYVVKSKELREKLATVSPCTFNAPVILVIGYDKNLDWKNKKIPGYSSGETDAAIVTTHMMLEARELGIGSCWVGMFSDTAVAGVLGLPDNVQVTALLPMGYPAEGVEPLHLHYKHREIEEMVTIL